MKSKIVQTLIILLLVLIYILAKPYLSRSSYINQIERAQEQNLLKDELALKSCQLFDDKDGIAHIKAENEIVSYACWGYIQARDRAGQMDYLRRIAYGKKAEVGGYKDIKSDFFVNVVGLPDKAREIYSQMSLGSQKLLWAFSYGVNKALLEHINSHKVYEFEKMLLFPEPWIAENSIAILLLQSLEQTKDNFLRKLDEENWKKKHGEKALGLFSKENLPWATYIIKEDDSWSTQISTKKSQTKTTELLHQHQFPINTQPIEDLRKNLFPEENWGSNSWVLSPDKTETKNAWVANDPHLSLKNPPFWYWLHVETPEFNTIGANLPGAPVFANGANPYVGWGLTNSYLPVGNLYFVPKKEIEDDPRLISFRPLIWFKFWRFKIPFFFKSFQRIDSRWPLLPLDLNPELSVIYHWSTLDLDGKGFEAFFDLTKANSAENINQILSNIKLNSWNFVFSDIKGNIGYRATGLVHRYEQKPTFGIAVKPLKEILDLLAGKKYLDKDEIPHLFNPKRGWVVTANNRQFDQSAPFFLGTSSNSEFRAHRIEELLSSTSQPMDLDKIRQIQCDYQAQDARILLPLLNGYLQPLAASNNTNKALAILNKWDLQTTVNCKECFLFRRWMGLIYESQNLNVISLYRSLTDPNLAKKEQFSEILSSQLEQSYQEYLALLKSDRKWGDLHINQFVHLWGEDFNKPLTIATPGDEETVSPGTSDWDGHFFKHRSGASQRLVIEMANPPRVFSIMAGENADHETPDLNNPDLAWKKWANCQLSQRIFPLDWQSVQLSKIIL
jgi:penicillin amidase